MQIRRFAICVTLLSSHAALATSVCDAQWQLATIRQLDGSSAVALPALRQDVSEGWNRIAQIPYMVYLPERDRIAMLLNVDIPLQAVIVTSDDQGATWSVPRYVREGTAGGPGNLSAIGTGLTHLRDGWLLLHRHNHHWSSIDGGDSWGDPRPISPSMAGKAWHEWDPLLVDRDPTTGAVTRLMSFCSEQHPCVKRSHTRLRWCRSWTALL